MEVVGGVASVVGVATAVLQAVKALINDIDNIKNVPALIRNVRGDLAALAPVLQKLKDAAMQNGRQLNSYEVIKPAIANCSQACDDFKALLATWTKRSSGLGTDADEPTRISSIKVGLLGQNRIQLFRTQLSSCKATLTLALAADRFIEPQHHEDWELLFQRLGEITESNQQQLLAIEQSRPDPEEKESREALIKDIRAQLNSDKGLKAQISQLAASLPKKQPENELVSNWSSRLRLTDPEQDRRILIDTTGQRVGATCEWITRNAAYLSWIDGMAPFLWLRGETGKGKTTLSIFLSEYLSAQTAKTNTHLIYYFCGKQDEKRNTATAILRSLLWQLTKKPTLTNCVARHLEQHGEPLLSEAEGLWKMFAALMNDTDCGTVYCVLDGLDELEDDLHLWLARKLLTLFAPGAREPQLNVLRLLLVSRDIPDFKLRGQSILLNLDNDADAEVNADIGRVVDARLLAVPDWNVFNDDYRSRVRHEVILKANGSFVPIDIIMKAVRDRPYSGLLETVQSLPQGLDALYGSSLLDIQHQQRHEAPAVLRWVAMAFRPLSLEELVSAVGSQSATPLDESAILATVQRCSALLKVHEDTVIFSHSSARDYLLRSARDLVSTLDQFEKGQLDMIDKLRIDPQEAHLEIALKCLQLIKASHLQHKIFDSPDDWQDAPLLKYAVLYWPHHAQGSGDVGKKLFTSTSFVLSAETQLTSNWWRTYLHESPGEEWEQGEELSPLHIACRFGIVEWVRSLLDEAEKASVLKIIIDEYDVSGATPLAWAAIGGHEAVVELLLDHGADIKLLTALRSGGSRDRFSGRTAQSYTREVLNSNGMFTGRHTTLYRAAYKGHPAVVKLLLERGADVHAHGCARSSAMHAVAISGNVEVMKLLLQYGGDRDVDAELKTVCTTPLHYAVENGNLEVVRMLLDNGADIKKRQSYSRATVLHFAPWQSAKPEVVELLLERGAEIETRDSHYRKPIHLFSQRHASPEAVKLLLDGGAKIDALNSLRQNALDIAIDCDCNRCMGTTQLLLSYGARLRNPYGNGRIHHPELFKNPEKSWDPLDRLKASSSIGSDDSLPNSANTSPLLDSDLASFDDRSSIAEGGSMMERLSIGPLTPLTPPMGSETNSDFAKDPKLEQSPRVNSDVTSIPGRESLVEEASIVGEGEGEVGDKPLRKRDRFKAKMKRMVS